MNLHVTRSQNAKSKFFGGAETIFSLSMRAEVTDDEAQLIKKHGEDQYVFDMPEEFAELFVGKRLEGPMRVTLPDLLRGVQYNCKYLDKSFCQLPQLFAQDYAGLLGRIRARENWGGDETLPVEI